MRRDGDGEEILQDHAGPGRQRPAQLVALAVVAAEADGVDLADPQRDQVVQDRPGRARLAADLHHVVDRQARLDRRLVLGAGRCAGTGRGRSRPTTAIRSAGYRAVMAWKRSAFIELANRR